MTNRNHYMFYAIYFLFSLILVPPTAFAKPPNQQPSTISLTIYAYPQEVSSTSPSFLLRVKNKFNQWETQTVTASQSVTIDKNNDFELIISDVGGCTLNYWYLQNGYYWYYGTSTPISFTSGQRNIVFYIFYDCSGTTYYRDADGDGYGDPNNSTVATSQPYGYVDNDDDCYDNDATKYLGETWFKDSDADGYTDGSTQTACNRPSGYSLETELLGQDDCDDDNAAINPGATEICQDGVDQNCDGSDACGTPYYLDADQDGYGDSGSVLYAESQPAGYVTNGDDCDDNDADEYPGQIWYLDADQDGYGSGTSVTACSQPGGNYKVSNDLSAVSGDCNDNDGSIHPNATEVCEDGIDQDCDGSDSSCLSDNDGDGSPATEDCDDGDDTIWPGAVEIPGDGIDQNCDGSDATADTCVDLADAPLDTQLDASAPNLMFGLDDSGSMDWEIMTSETESLFEVGNRDYEYVFADPGDNLYQTGVYSYSVKTSGKQDYWRSQWHEYNVIYYNPSEDYDPWNDTLGDADPDNPRSHPYYDANYFDLSALYGSIDGVTIPNAHYYVWSDAASLPYLVIIDGGAITYYKVNETGERIGTGDLSQTSSPPADVVTGRTYAEERQNFANWYSYYRKRRSTSVSAIAKVLPELQGVMVGMRSINGHIIQSVLPVGVEGVDQSEQVLDKLFSYHPGTHTIGGTPLRKGLQKIGQYYHVDETINPSEPELATSPLSIDASGECQQNFAIMFTDGAYNGLSPGLGNVDGAYSAPYADDASNTLADVAMYYWQEDLAPGLDDNVPTNFYDTATWQHMVTYTVSFGVQGNLNQDDYDLDNIVEANRIYPTWPSPINSDKERIDDLWHTAVNGKGVYLSASTPQELVDAFEQVVSNVLARIGSGASVSINGEELQEGLVLYQSIYSTNRWTGDVIAYEVDSSTGAVDLESPIWSGSEVLDAAINSNSDYWDTGRLIATYDDSIASPAGIPFRFAKLNTAQQAVLTSSDMVEYLRGNHANEEQNSGTLRSRYLLDDNGNYLRATVLSDVVHSAPLYFGDTIYAGGNDGMLHAFDASSGKELFAYVPNLVFENLANLTDPDYTHQYYVDLTPYAKTIDVESTSILTGLTSVTYQSLLVGGLGKGGKGVYCLDITDASTAVTTEDILASRVLWEFPNSTTSTSDINDMGYSYAKAFIVETRSSAHPWVAIFGNGYNSPNHDAVLFIVDALTGDLVKKISTGANSACNGLSTPLAIDVVMEDSNVADLMVSGSDGKVDYVYAGDLLGNLWKFDLTSEDTTDWDVAYKNGSANMPLFQAKDDYGNPQPITTKPNAMYHCDSSMHGYLIFFGTGRYLGITDLTHTSQQTLYGIWDYGDDSDDSEYLGSFERNSTQALSNQPQTVSLLEQSIYWTGTVNSTEYRILTDNTITWATVVDPDTPPNSDTVLYDNPSDVETNQVGWYFDLPDSGERIVRDLEIRSGKVVLITSIPQTDSPCVAGGESWLMEIDACSGGRTSDAELDINDDGVIDDDDKITVTVNGQTLTLPPTGLKYSTMMYPPMIVDNPDDDTELKYFSTSSGSVVIMQEDDEGVGMTFWRFKED